MSASAISCCCIGRSVVRDDSRISCKRSQRGQASSMRASRTTCSLQSRAAMQPDGPAPGPSSSPPLPSPDTLPSSSHPTPPTRRHLLSSAATLSAASLLLSLPPLLHRPLPAAASVFPPAPEGFRRYLDRLDGYQLDVPETWVEVRGAGADVFFRNPFVLEEAVFVSISSPSSTKFNSVADLGTPEQAGEGVLKQYLLEYMSTRLGVRRDSQLLYTNEKTGASQQQFYEVEVNVKSFATQNQLAVMPEERDVIMEWDRRFLSLLGVENKRLYELRIQVPEKVLAKEEEKLRQILDSFRLIPLED